MNKHRIHFIFYGFFIVLVMFSKIYADTITPNQGTIKKSALVMIEFQREWIGPDGKLTKLMKDTAQFEKSKKQAQTALRAARKSGMPVVHVGLFLNGNYEGLGGDHAKYGLRNVIQKYGTWKENGCRFAEGFEPHSNEFVVQGRLGGSAFAGSNLDSYLRNNQINRIYLAGYALHVCVESTLRDGHDRGYEVILLEDATSAFTSEQRDYVLKNVLHHFGAYSSVEKFTASIERKQKTYK